MKQEKEMKHCSCLMIHCQHLTKCGQSAGERHLWQFVTVVTSSFLFNEVSVKWANMLGAQLWKFKNVGVYLGLDPLLTAVLAD